MDEFETEAEYNEAFHKWVMASEAAADEAKYDAFDMDKK